MACLLSALMCRSVNSTVTKSPPILSLLTVDCCFRINFGSVSVLWVFADCNENFEKLNSLSPSLSLCVSVRVCVCVSSVYVKFVSCCCVSTVALSNYLFSSSGSCPYSTCLGSLNFRLSSPPFCCNTLERVTVLAACLSLTPLLELPKLLPMPPSMSEPLLVEGGKFSCDEPLLLPLCSSLLELLELLRSLPLLEESLKQDDS